MVEVLYRDWLHFRDRLQLQRALADISTGACCGNQPGHIRAFTDHPHPWLGFLRSLLRAPDAQMRYTDDVHLRWYDAAHIPVTPIRFPSLDNYPWLATDARQLTLFATNDNRLPSYPSVSVLYLHLQHRPILGHCPHVRKLFLVHQCSQPISVSLAQFPNLETLSCVSDHVGRTCIRDWEAAPHLVRLDVNFLVHSPPGPLPQCRQVQYGGPVSESWRIWLFEQQASFLTHLHLMDFFCPPRETRFRQLHTLELHAHVLLGTETYETMPRLERIILHWNYLHPDNTLPAAWPSSLRVVDIRCSPPPLADQFRREVREWIPTLPLPPTEFVINRQVRWNATRRWFEYIVT
jgi:hypothetical protein